MTATPHRCTFRVYYEDTDAGGVVYYANYLKFAERGRTELLRELGFENTSLRDREGTIFVVRRVVADYRKPARLDDVLEVETAIRDVGNTSVVMDQTISCHNYVVCTVEVLLVCTGPDFRPVRFPAEVKQAFEGIKRDG